MYFRYNLEFIHVTTTAIIDQSPINTKLCDLSIETPQRLHDDNNPSVVNYEANTTVAADTISTSEYNTKQMCVCEERQSGSFKEQGTTDANTQMTDTRNEISHLEKKAVHLQDNKTHKRPIRNTEKIAGGVKTSIRATRIVYHVAVVEENIKEDNDIKLQCVEKSEPYFELEQIQTHFQQKMEIQLKECVLHHQQILRCHNKSHLLIQT